MKEDKGSKSSLQDKVETPPRVASTISAHRIEPVLVVPPKVEFNRWGRLFNGLVLATLALIIVWVSLRVRSRLALRGVLPSAFRILGYSAGGIAISSAVWGVAALLPNVTPEVLGGSLILIGILVVVATRGVLPDLLYGVLIRFERRVRVDVRVEGDGFAGTVVRAGWRSTVLRTPRGTLEIPNRQLLAGPLRTTGAAEHELVLRLDHRLSTSRTRRRIEDAVVASAWTPPTPHVRVHRDPRDSGRWIVNTHLLDSKFAPAFDADLPERLESWLAVTRSSGDKGEVLGESIRDELMSGPHKDVLTTSASSETEEDFSHH